MKVANREEAVVGVPVIVEPVEVQVTLRTIPVEVRHVAVAIDLANGALYEKSSIALLRELRMTEYIPETVSYL